MSANTSNHTSQNNSSLSVVVALNITPLPSSPPIHLINTYLPPMCSKIAQVLGPSLKQPTLGPVLLGIDSNLHHPTWNPPAYHHTTQAAEDLILLAASHHLTLRSELGIPTFYATSDRQTNTTIDLVWTDAAAHNLATPCVTDVLLEHSHSSDHAAIITTLSLPDRRPLTPPAPCLNWKKADKSKLKSLLDSTLNNLINLPSPISNRADLQLYVDQVTLTINSAVQESVPMSSPPSNARR